MIKRKMVNVAACLALLGGAQQANASEYPNRPIRLVVPSPPGGGTDGTSRLITSKIAEVADWNFIVDNRPGGGNNIGLGLTAQAKPDGYTLAMGETSNLAVNPFLYKSLNFDATKDLVPVALVASGAVVLVVQSESPYNDLASLVEASKKNQLAYASSGSGTVGHLVSESLRLASNGDFLHVPYKGAGPAMIDMLAGRVDFYFASLTASLPHIKTGKLRPLAITSSERHSALPNVPTLIESGYEGAEFLVFYGIVGPSRMPDDVVRVVNEQVNKALNAPDVKEKLAIQGVQPRPMSPEAFSKFLGSERTKWARIVKSSGASVD
jgi:tripartite-type tricarboxylate transporter receptor subunit TctC